MASVINKLRLFQEAIQREIEKEENAINREIDKARKDALALAEDSGLESSYGIIRQQVAQLEAQYKKELGGRKMEQKKTFLQRRRELEEQIFSNVAARLLKYAQSPEYKTGLLEKVREIAAECPYESAVLKIRPADASLEEEIKAAFGLPCTVELSSEIEIGGLIYVSRDKNYLINESLDERLRSQRDWFHSHNLMEVAKA
ncbi:MAG: hypothetical protein LBC56_08825 [Oscillospiraceae bacterium]|nr:hypothetical protein [Oscillospiraceae bacterium]